MNLIPDIKVAILRGLKRFEGKPVQQALFASQVKNAIPNSLMGDINTAFDLLEEDGYILRLREPVTERITVTLTAAGQHAAAQIG